MTPILLEKGRGRTARGPSLLPAPLHTGPDAGMESPRPQSDESMREDSNAESRSQLLCEVNLHVIWGLSRFSSFDFPALLNDGGVVPRLGVRDTDEVTSRTVMMLMMTGLRGILAVAVSLSVGANGLQVQDLHFPFFIRSGQGAVVIPSFAVLALHAARPFSHEPDIAAVLIEIDERAAKRRPC